MNPALTSCKQKVIFISHFDPSDIRGMTCQCPTKSPTVHVKNVDLAISPTNHSSATVLSKAQRSDL